MTVARPTIGDRRRPDVVFAIVLVVVLTILSIGPLVTPPAPQSLSPDEFSTDRALAHTAQIAIEPHPIGSEEIVAVRHYIVNELTTIGFFPEMQETKAPDYFGTPGRTVDVVNIVARLEGVDSSGAMLLMAHFDSVPTTPGANDNAAAVGVLLEIGRLLTQRAPLANDVILLFTDGEEPFPRFGSSAVVEDHAWADDVGFVANLEAVGGSGPSTVAEVAGPRRWVIGGYATNASNPAAYSFITEIVGKLGDIGTDFDSFRELGIPGIHFAYMRGSPIYHTMEDSMDSVSADSVGHHATNVLGIIDAFGGADLANPPESDAGVYFTVGRSFLIRYSIPWVLPLTALAILVFGVALLVGVRRDGMRLKAALTYAVVVFGAMLAAVVVTTLVWLMIVGFRSSPRVAESYAYLGLLVLVTAGVWGTVPRYRSRVSTSPELLAAVTLVWLVFAAATSLWLPGTSYLFLWPAIAASLVLLGVPYVRSGVRWVGAASLAVVATPVLVLIVPATEMVFQMAMPRPGNTDSEMAWVVGVSTLLAFLGIALVHTAWKIGSHAIAR
jgi:hypothetical protein